MWSEMRSDLKVLVAGPKGSGKTTELVRICYDMNLPFIVGTEEQLNSIEKISKQILMPIKIKFVGELMEDGYEGPIVIERGVFFSKMDWRYIQNHCVIYAESREVDKVIYTKKSYTESLSWMFAGCFITLLMYHYGGLRFAGVFGVFVGLARLIVGLKSK
jgi:hypothetical protein